MLCWTVIGNEDRDERGGPTGTKKRAERPAGRSVSTPGGQSPENVQFWAGGQIKMTLKAQHAEDVAHVRKVRPELVAVFDAAPDNWTFLRNLQPDEWVVDFFSCTSRQGFRPSRATGTKNTALPCATI